MYTILKVIKISQFTVQGLRTKTKNIIIKFLFFSK